MSELELLNIVIDSCAANESFWPVAALKLHEQTIWNRRGTGESAYVCD